MSRADARLFVTVIGLALLWLGVTRLLAEICEPQSAWIWGMERCK